MTLNRTTGQCTKRGIHGKLLASLDEQPAHMSRASPANRTDLSHENLYFSTA